MKDWKQLLLPENWHEAAAVLPLIEEAELQSLADNIKADGLREPIMLLDGKILDGRNRLNACARAGVQPTFVEWSGNDPVAWVISKNVHRRQLTQSQKAAAAVEFITLLKQDASIEGDKRIEIADRMGIGRHYTSDAFKIAEQDKGLLAQIKSGAISIPSAKRQLEWKANGGVKAEGVDSYSVNKVLYSFMRGIPPELFKAMWHELSTQYEISDEMRELWRRIDTEVLN